MRDKIQDILFYILVVSVLVSIGVFIAYFITKDPIIGNLLEGIGVTDAILWVANLTIFLVLDD